MVEIKNTGIVKKEPPKKIIVNLTHLVRDPSFWTATYVHSVSVTVKK